MKRILYSVYTKIAICILCVVSVFNAVSIGLDGAKEWVDYENEVYLLEDRFEDSHYLFNVLNHASFDVFNTSVTYINYNSFDVKESLQKKINSNHMDCYLSIDDKEYGNINAKNEKYMYFIKLKVDKDGVLEREMNPDKEYYYVDAPAANGHNVEICIGLKDQYVSNMEDLWHLQRTLVHTTFTNVMLWACTFIACFVYLVIVIGKDEEENIHAHKIDKLYIEFNLAIIACIIGISLLLLITLFNQYFYSDLSYGLLKRSVQLIAIIGTSGLLTFVLSMIRNIKNKTFISRCLSLVIIKKIIKLVKSIINEINVMFANHMTITVVGMLFVYSALMGYFGIRTWDHIFYMILAVILFIIVAYFVIKYLNSLNMIKVGVNKIRNGDLNYKIEPLCFKDLNGLKEGINDISSGLQASVTKTLKAERLKTELITNVSHDLKTPLTSIINYTKLLSNIDNLPEEAKDYLSIIDKKSQRLKVLTQDLFDISKVQSGNEVIELEKLNVETLLTQSLAEHENELANLTVCTRIEEELYILSDGRKMSRVINNLLINIIKYTMPHTRVFIDAYSKDNKVLIEMKNISSYPLDFDKEEIMQRFKRGDESRSDEGHGLGLAIAKSYIEVTGGRFDIVLDGDMFEAIIEYDKK